MTIRISMIGACVLGTLAAGANAQTNVDRSFTASGKTCAEVHWSEATLQKYPQIGNACREVLERDGVRFVKFEGTLNTNVEHGKELKVKFRGANEMTLTPPPELNVYIDNRKVPVHDLKRGDELTFYVAEDRLAARFYAESASPTTTTEYVLVPILYTEHLAQATPAALPATGSRVPLVGMSGLLLTAFAFTLSLRRIVRRHTRP